MNSLFWFLIRRAKISVNFSLNKKGKEKGELPRLKCLHNGIILIVNCFQNLYDKNRNLIYSNKCFAVKIIVFNFRGK
jgi:hypothetical protein